MSKAELNRAGLTRSTSYELFVLGVSLLSFINLVLLVMPIGEQLLRVVTIIDAVTSVIFFCDFLLRWLSAPNKRQYFFHQYGWSDLLASLPVTAFNLLRIFRILKFVRAMRFLGLRGIARLLKTNPEDTALYTVFFMILLLLEFGSIAVLIAEHSAATANIKSGSDAIWWVFVSITTVGYGDHYPVTGAGRLVGVVTLTVGVGLFGVVTGYLSNLFIRNKAK